MTSTSHAQPTTSPRCNSQDAVSGHEVIGLTAGASTPGELVDATIERLAALGYREVVEITVAREDVHFRLPREVASA